MAAVVSGLPSTAYHLATGRSLLEPVRAAGTLVLPHAPPHPLLAAGAVVHLAVSLGWGAVLGVVLPRRRAVAWGAIAGLAIAGLDLGLVGRRFPAIRVLPALPQVADHVAYGAVVGAVLTGADPAEGLCSSVRSLRSLRNRAGWRGGSIPPRR